ncbi:hypothetical protein L248_3164 [Schleiferilactobacillus shenzhenensis LY-73]|uniref:Uncharacterized protein n=1 Tax=Schleiferilactobacillus shenzhenensis LY-73 TaxID=1231336 RepID=U4TU86_9LACO|nr:hypothetical protein L248_3164 [Schleiferilactobacillus shenzhenensis LY-73]
MTPKFTVTVKGIIAIAEFTNMVFTTFRCAQKPKAQSRSCSSP